MLKCEWSFSEIPGGEPTLFIERAFNIHTMYDSKVDLGDRIHTFEAMTKKGAGATCCSVDSNVPDQLHKEINFCILQIRDHLSAASGIALKQGTFFFKYDKADHLYLVYAGGLNASKVNCDDQEPSLATANQYGVHPVLKCVNKHHINEPAEPFPKFHHQNSDLYENLTLNEQAKLIKFQNRISGKESSVEPGTKRSSNTNFTISSRTAGTGGQISRGQRL